MIIFTKGKNKLTVSGHAMSAPYGKDIVCASVSTLVITNTNLLSQLDKKENYQLTINEKKAYYQLNLIRPNMVNQAVLDNIYWYLKELMQNYPNYLKEEV